LLAVTSACPTNSEYHLFVGNFVANFVENGRKSTKFPTTFPTKFWENGFLGQALTKHIINPRRRGIRDRFGRGSWRSLLRRARRRWPGLCAAAVPKSFPRRFRGQ